MASLKRDHGVLISRHLRVWSAWLCFSGVLLALQIANRELCSGSRFQVPRAPLRGCTKRKRSRKRNCFPTASRARRSHPRLCTLENAETPARGSRQTRLHSWQPGAAGGVDTAPAASPLRLPSVLERSSHTPSVRNGHPANVREARLAAVLRPAAQERLRFGRPQPPPRESAVPLPA